MEGRGGAWGFLVADLNLLMIELYRGSQGNEAREAPRKTLTSERQTIGVVRGEWWQERDAGV